MKEQTDERMTTMEADLTGITTRVEDAEKGLSEVKQTADG